MEGKTIAFFGDGLELHIVLQEIEPAIWRRLRVPADLSLAELHDVLQISFGWKEYHLHDFQVGDVRFATVDVEEEVFCAEEKTAPLGAVAQRGSHFEYRYDFGDGWQHTVAVERVVDGPALDGPLIECLGGERACPPEDCGGPGGYARMLEILLDPSHDEHREMKQWVGRGYDPEKFNLEATNRKLAALSKTVDRRRRARRRPLGR
jgi:hypothetical protein